MEEVFPFILAALLVSHCFADLKGDANALLGVKDQLAGKGNPVFSSWVDDDPCVWAGVTCTNGRVTALNLSSKGLNGIFPSELGNLSHLESLDLLNNAIRGPIPASLSSLTNLKTIELSGNPLLGEFPETILKIKSLVNLRLGQCNLTGAFPNIRELPLLENLILNSNGFTGPLPDLSDLPLVELSLWGTKLGPDWKEKIGSLKNLSSLNLHSCGLEGTLPAEWESLRKIESMYLNNNNLIGPIPDSWSQMTKLKALSLDMNNLTGTIPSWFSHLNLTDVFLFCNYFSGDVPNGYPERNIKGNCFENGNLRDHGTECADSTGCPFTKSKRTNRTMFISVGGSFAAVSVFATMTFFFWKCRGTKRIIYKDEETGEVKTWEAPAGIERFELKQISKATNGFSEDCQIGSGGFGKVYRGSLSDGRVVAIKKGNIRGGQGHREFLNEISLLSRLHHRNLVQLIGFCHQGKHQVLVYEFMENGNLHHLLLGNRCLDWFKRLEIATGVAQGIDYLHSFADPPVIHRDLKPSNILLDGSLVAKIADFGISKVSLDTHVSTAPAGTCGYLDPEYFIRRQLTTASDVYSFGMVLLELITGQKAIDHKRPEEFNLVEWVRPRLRSEGVHAIVDHRLGNDYPEHVFEVLANTALHCAAFDKTKRPSMKAVLGTLTSLKKVVSPSTGREISEEDTTSASETWTTSACTIETFTCEH